jgi:hypothetical protein
MAFLIELPQSPRYDRVVMPRKRVTDAFSPEKNAHLPSGWQFCFQGVVSMR